MIVLVRFDLLSHLLPVLLVFISDSLLQVLRRIRQVSLAHPECLVFLRQTLTRLIEQAVLFAEPAGFLFDQDHLLLQVVVLSGLVLINTTEGGHAELLQRVLLLFSIAVFHLPIPVRLLFGLRGRIVALAGN